MKQLILILSLAILIGCSHENKNINTQSKDSLVGKTKPVLKNQFCFNRKNIMLRNSPDENAGIIDTIKFGDSVGIIDKLQNEFQWGAFKSNWNKVLFNNVVGYCPDIFFSEFHIPKANVLKKLIIKKYLNQFLNDNDYKYEIKYGAYDDCTETVHLAKTNIGTAYCLFFNLGLIEKKTPYPPYCKKYNLGDNGPMSIEIKADYEDKSSEKIKKLFFKWFYAGGETTLVCEQDSNSGSKMTIYYSGD